MTSPAVHLRSRIEAGLLLGRLGDPRFAVERVQGVRVILPPAVNIAGGKATIGSGRWPPDSLAEKREKPRHDVRLAPYALGRYPVTNAEYACFTAAGGYDDESLWTAGGRHWRRGEPVPGEPDPSDFYLKHSRMFRDDPAEIDRRIRSGWMTERDADQVWRILATWDDEHVVAQVRRWYPVGSIVTEPRFWKDDSLNNPSQPVVGVTWYEAAAYAAWLARLTGAGWRLPTEPEWEWAARRGRRLFPWGGNWDERRLNSLEGRVMRTTPVGAYPHGATPDGIYDLAGNVYEWTSTLAADYPYVADASREDPDAAGIRIARGGGWAAVCKMVRGAYRIRFYPWGRDLILGYRLAWTLS